MAEAISGEQVMIRLRFPIAAACAASLATLIVVQHTKAGRTQSELSPRPRGPALVQHGYDVFQYHCASCHGAGDGGRSFIDHRILPLKPGTAALQAKYKGELPALLERRTDLHPDVVSYFVRNGVSIMPQFRKTDISDADLNALGAYLSRNSKSVGK